MAKSIVQMVLLTCSSDFARFNLQRTLLNISRLIRQLGRNTLFLFINSSWWQGIKMLEIALIFRQILTIEQMKIGIFFGGISREREVSFLGGKTAFENLDKLLFEPIPVFVDGKGNFILINQTLMYRPEIRDFYPPQTSLSPTDFSVYIESLSLTEAEEEATIAKIGQRIYPHQFKQLFDFVFLALHGPGGEDGSLQGLLEWYGLPYNGPDVLSSGVSMDKIYQNYLIERTVGLDKKTSVLQKDEFLTGDIAQIFERVKQEVGVPFVVKAPHQGSSIGVAFVKKDDLSIFENAVKQCLFIAEVSENQWKNESEQNKKDLFQKMVNLDEGIGFPVEFQGQIINHPQALSNLLDQYFEESSSPAVITSIHTEDAVLFEAFVDGQEFSCGVIQDAQGRAVALPPTEIVKLEADGVFDFKTKYKKSTTRKNIPIETSLANNQKAQAMVRDCFVALKFGTCTRIDGFLTPDNRVILHDPNTIPGMSPASLIFKQMAEIGFSVTDSLTYFIRQSIRERIRTGKFAVQYNQLLQQLDADIANKLSVLTQNKKIAIVFDDSDQDYAKAKLRFAHFSALGLHKPVGVLKSNGQYFILPTNLMFKEFVGDVEALITIGVHPLIVETRQNAESITKHFMGTLMPDIQIVEILNEADFEVVERV